MEYAAASPYPAGVKNYRWHYGDTLASVARAHGTTEQAIKHINRGVDFDSVPPGALISMPPGTLTCPNGALYTVRPGDSFTSIARAFGVATQSLVDQNPYIDPTTLRAGQILCVPNAPKQAWSPAPPDIPCPPGYARKRVAFGQSLGDVLTLNDLSLMSFQLANPSIDINRLAPGQAYCVPPPSLRGLCENGTPYTLRAGESLSSLTLAARKPPEAFLRANPALAPTEFTPGRRICVPE